VHLVWDKMTRDETAHPSADHSDDGLKPSQILGTRAPRWPKLLRKRQSWK
jgi:hypothetical protein